jgi:ABC-type Fe3+-hydroxamate transport system substrate-binding protein
MHLHFYEGKMKEIKHYYLCFYIFFAILCSAVPVFSHSIAFTDAQGKHISITQSPVRVVSLVPGITEIIFRIGAGDAVKAVTHYDTYPLALYEGCQINKGEKYVWKPIFKNSIFQRHHQYYGNC